MSTRRKFLKTTALTGTGFMIVPRHVLGGPGYTAPSDKANIAIVGVGGRGIRNAKALMALEDVHISAIADPAEYWDLSNFYYKIPGGRGPANKMLTEHYAADDKAYKIKEYEDFEEMLEKETSLDGILCATPDHTHAYVSIKAMQAGKHVYCEKPLTHNIWEARRVAQIAKETGLSTQMGNQLHSSENIRTTVEYLKAGAIGHVSEVHAWVPASRWIASLDSMPGTTTPLPKGLNWNLWLGPRADRGFHEHFAPVTWRDFWDFGCGAMGDFGCHDLDAAVWGLDLPAPDTITLHPAGFSNQDIAPYGEIGYFHFPERADKPAVNLTWYAGGLKPKLPDLIPAEVELPRRGALYVGEKGAMLYGGGFQKPRLFPESLDLSFSVNTPTLSLTNGHHRDWVNGIKGGPSPSSNFGYGAHLTEITLLGVLSLRMGGKTIHWDAENMKAKGLPEADAFIQEPVRTGWEM